MYCNLGSNATGSMLPDTFILYYSDFGCCGHASHHLLLFFFFFFFFSSSSPQLHFFSFVWNSNENEVRQLLLHGAGVRSQSQSHSIIKSTTLPNQVYNHKYSPNSPIDCVFITQEYTIPISIFPPWVDNGMAGFQDPRDSWTCMRACRIGWWMSVLTVQSSQQVNHGQRFQEVPVPFPMVPTLQHFTDVSHPAHHDCLEVMGVNSRLSTPLNFAVAGTTLSKYGRMHTLQPSMHGRSSRSQLPHVACAGCLFLAVVSRRLHHKRDNTQKKPSVSLY